VLIFSTGGFSEFSEKITKSTTSASSEISERVTKSMRSRFRNFGNVNEINAFHVSQSWETSLPNLRRPFIVARRLRRPKPLAMGSSGHPRDSVHHFTLRLLSGHSWVRRQQRLLPGFVSIFTPSHRPPTGADTDAPHLQMLGAFWVCGFFRHENGNRTFAIRPSIRFADCSHPEAHPTG